MARIEFRLSEELKRRIGAEADLVGLPMNEYMARVLADHIGEPELAKIPRISIGRPRNKDAANGKAKRLAHAK